MWINNWNFMISLREIKKIKSGWFEKLFLKNEYKWIIRNASSLLLKFYSFEPSQFQLVFCPISSQFWPKIVLVGPTAFFFSTKYKSFSFHFSLQTRREKKWILPLFLLFLFIFYIFYLKFPFSYFPFQQEGNIFSAMRGLNFQSITPIAFHQINKLYFLSHDIITYSFDEIQEVRWIEFSPSVGQKIFPSKRGLMFVHNCVRLMSLSKIVQLK